MARDIRELLKEDVVSKEAMPKHHEARFLKKLDQAMPVSKPRHHWLRIAASVIVLLGFSFMAFQFYNSNQKQIEISPEIITNTPSNDMKTLGDVSPGLKKVEDYYLASINLELAKIKYTPETKELFDGYVKQLEELDNEYQRLSQELTNSGPSELTVNALIDNLKFRLNLLYRLRAQLQELKPSSEFENQNQSI
ncbi:hypothetical protein [Aestuariibaculum suncheonense]|uniref:Anti-sigma factor n=1 Tax=Aestuariibaculum suncheonense TaxID=1028745 RepID=A0A8J6QA08_9FLAO|nr:hypothetical protein [Aestuariibaculum suncheonense]MBD0835885.1 hypothetical protein [Aestuariibaculum suncheonense]